MPKSELKKLASRSINLGLDLQGGMHLVLQVDMSKLKDEEKEGARDRALEIIRNRIDQFGVSEPTIAKQGTDKIIIELPGVVDRERAKEIIGRTAQLQFRLVEKDETTQEFLKEMDEALYEVLKKEEARLGTEDTLEILENPLLGLIYRGRIVETDVKLMENYLARDEVRSFIPKKAEFLFSKIEEREGLKSRELLLVKKEAVLKGDAIVNAQAGIGTEKNPMGSKVDLTMTARARRNWARITGQNVGKRIAIVLDDKVQSAPVVIERIAGGRSMIEMGGASFEDAHDLALIIRAGALPAPVKPVFEKSVGASLGADSIKSGIRSIYIGGIIVLVFMIIYYSACGLVANFALFLNLLFLFAILSGFKATLTLPGLAGIILVIGTAVDANVLIFERIREELRTGKTMRAAISTGYSRAFRTILDANMTTFLAALILYYFGTGPIRGFAVTLSIGIVASFFTAIVVTRLIIDFFTSRFPVKRLLI